MEGTGLHVCMAYGQRGAGGTGDWHSPGLQASLELTFLQANKWLFISADMPRLRGAGRSILGDSEAPTSSHLMAEWETSAKGGGRRDWHFCNFAIYINKLKQLQQFGLSQCSDLHMASFIQCVKKKVLIFPLHLEVSLTSKDTGSAYLLKVAIPI